MPKSKLTWNHRTKADILCTFGVDDIDMAHDEIKAFCHNCKEFISLSDVQLITDATVVNPYD